MKKMMLIVLLCFNLQAANYYIDYEHGNDGNAGTKDKPFKHHPWDDKAEGIAAQTKGVNTYYFKKGVIYRGSLVAKESGEAGNPIILTADNTWGEGDALVYESDRAAKEWKKCAADDPLMPEKSKANVWCLDLDKSYDPHMLYELTSGKVVKVNIARSPNWKVTNPNDPRAGWWSWSSAFEDDGMCNFQDRANITQVKDDYWKGAIIWSETGLLINVLPAIVNSYDAKTRTIKAWYKNAEIADHMRYYIENHPSLLDVPNEYYYDRSNNRLYLWPEENRDPNKSEIEIPKRMYFLQADAKENITVDGLKICFNNTISCEKFNEVYRARFYTSGIILKGAVKNVKIKNCVFENLSHAVVSYPFRKDDLMDNLEVSGNTVTHTEGPAIIFCIKGYYEDKDKEITLFELGARYRHILMKGNKLYDCGFRNMNVGEGWSSGISVGYGGELVEVCDNEVDTVAGIGIEVFSAWDYFKVKLEYPLNRILVHNNKTTNCVLAFQDYGGIEGWNAGPMYFYNNISGNNVGFVYTNTFKQRELDFHRAISFAPGMYFDGGYKVYAFNNILWGKDNNVEDKVYNSAGFCEAMGFLHTIFNNTIYNCADGLHKGMAQHNRNYYLNNLFLNIPLYYVWTNISPNSVEYDSVGFAGNVFGGFPKMFAKNEKETTQEVKSLEDFKKFLSSKNAVASETGVMAMGNLVENAKELNFKPVKRSAVIDGAKKVFVPWGLYKVVGEWGFLMHRADPTLIMGENIDWTKEYKTRDIYHKVPRNNLTGVNIGENNYKIGLLENWVEGSVELNGKNQYMELKNGLNIDVADGNFLIEAVMIAKSGPVVSKGSGYVLTAGNDGKLRMSVYVNGAENYRESEAAVNDGKWHHVIAEVVRDMKDGINIYVDGKLSNGKSGITDLKGDLTNKESFLVGKKENEYFSGTIDFLRLSRGSLKDAETTIEELYKWEFDGPFLKDFYGNPPKGKARDVGAVEGDE